MNDVLQLDAAGWLMIAASVAFLLAVYACSVFSLQLCMAYFGEELPSFWGCAGLKLKLIVAAAATLLVGYAFLGPLKLLAAPAAFLVGLSLIGQAAKTDRFHSAIIALTHAALSTAAAALCAFVFWVGLSTLGYDAMVFAETIGLPNDTAMTYESYHSGDDTVPQRNVSHPNPFIDETVPAFDH